MKVSQLTERISNKIIALIGANSLEPGSHLSVPKLADSFDVSRSPVREALIYLEHKGIVNQQKNKGFFVNDDYLPEPQEEVVYQSDDSDLPGEYYQLADDWLQDRIDPEVTEQYLLKRYNISKTQLAIMLGRGISEGWVERKQGYGWRFLPVAKTKTSLAQIYNFRMVIEPMAILEPTFHAPLNKIAEMKQELESLLESGIAYLSPTQLQLAGYRFHETVIGFSNNPIFEISLKNVNRMRRLFDYRVMDDRERYYNEVKDHLRILELIETGQLIEASYTMKKHLAQALANKNRSAIGNDIKG